MIVSKNFFNQLIRSNMRVYDNIQKISTDQGNDYTTGCLKIIFISKIITNWQQCI